MQAPYKMNFIINACFNSAQIFRVIMDTFKVINAIACLF
jgi:hypothetical protein